MKEKTDKKSSQPHVVAVILEKSSRLFLSRRIDSKRFKNFWQNPGGKVEPGETPREAIVRETFEETGLRIKANRFKRIDTQTFPRSSQPYKITTYHLNLQSGEMPQRTEKKHGPWRPFSRRAALQRQNIVPGLQKVLQAI